MNKLTKEDLTKDFFLDITGYTDEEYNELSKEDIKDKWNEIFPKDLCRILLLLNDK